MTATKVLLIALCVLATVYAHGTSKTSFSKPHQGKFNYDIEHSKHGSWHGSAHPHGYGGLGSGHGSVHGGGSHGYSHGHGHHGHATSSANFNLHAISHGHHY